MGKGRIYYFSGTGNSMYVAKSVGEDLEIGVEKITKDTKPIESGEYVGLVFPVYAWGPPNLVKKFIKKLEGKKINYLFALTTCASQAGRTLDIVEDELKIVKQKLDYGNILNYPSNFIIASGAPSDKNINKLLKQSEKELVKIKEELGTQKIYIEETSLIERIIPKFVNEISLKYFVKMGKNLSADSDCTLCKLCEKECPVGNIEIINEKVIFGVRCELCLRCIQTCPTKAINYKNKTKNRKRYMHPCEKEIKK